MSGRPLYSDLKITVVFDVFLGFSSLSVDYFGCAVTAYNGCANFVSSGCFNNRGYTNYVSIWFISTTNNNRCFNSNCFISADNNRFISTYNRCDSFVSNWLFTTGHC